jgi:hypothetical protein
MVEDGTAGLAALLGDGEENRRNSLDLVVVGAVLTSGTISDVDFPCNHSRLEG